VDSFEPFQVVVTTVDLCLLNCNSYTLTVQIGKSAGLPFNAPTLRCKRGAVDSRWSTG
jgi:hypothetical protein